MNTTGGGNAQTIEGIVLATGANASVNLHPGAVDGEVVATTFTSSSGAAVQGFTTIPDPSSAWVLLPFVFGTLAITFSRKFFGTQALQNEDELTGTKS